MHFNDIKDTAVVNDTLRVVNRMPYLKSWPWYFDILNKGISVDKRNDLISNFIIGNVISNGKYYYYSDVDSECYHFKDGFRSVSGYTPTLENDEKSKVTLLGDSRFVDALVPTEMTMASYLQERLMKYKLNIEVKNFSVEANRIQNSFQMLKSLDIGEKDIIICAVQMLGQYPDFKVDSAEKNLYIRLRIMRDMMEYCKSKKAKLIFLKMPIIRDIPNPTDLEKLIAQLYGDHFILSTISIKLKQLCTIYNIPLIDLDSLMITAKRNSLFIDSTHFSSEGSKLIANTLADYIRFFVNKDELIDNEEINELTEKAYDAHKHYVTEARFKGITAYVKKLQEIANGKPDNCGAIVMNCNPFTLGHRYLIEQAASQVEYLYILAVEEDRSVFKFKDRFEMIRQGVADIPNVEVIPSGKFVISSLTFPEYFEKSKKPDMTVDTSSDIELFCEYIAPALNIKTRFVGEEPLDMVTNQYNTCMKEKLPKYGLNIIEIPRKEFNDAPISASRVRKLLEEKKYEDVKEIVPQTTYDYLINVLGY